MSLLYEGTREFGLDLSPEQLASFETFFRLLVEWNEKFNLTAITEYADVQVKHFLDSLAVVRALPKGELDGKRVIDIGAGAGFPGVPLAIAFPYLRVTLVEATGKKVRFLDELVRELGLENVIALKARAEELAHDAHHRERYDFAVARAVAYLRTLAEYTLPFVRAGGSFIAQKGPGAEDENYAAAHAIDTMGGKTRELIAYDLPTLDETRYLVVIDKVAPTPRRYPRRAGLPEKKPL
jgi:16S rRNA (guanine527-N7)-methyltransferase